VQVDGGVNSKEASRYYTSNDSENNGKGDADEGISRNNFTNSKNDCVMDESWLLPQIVWMDDVQN